MNHKRIWRQEGLKVPKKQPKRGRLWLADGSCLRRRAERANHVWSYDFVFERTHDGRALKLLTIIWRRPHSALGYRPPGTIRVGNSTCLCCVKGC